MSYADRLIVEHLQNFAESVHAAVAELMGERSCIDQVRTAVDAGRHFTYAVRPVPVWTWAATPDWWAAMLEAGSFEALLTRDEKPPGSAVGILGTGAMRDDHWDGHLVGHIERRWVADFSIQQFHRPDWGVLATSPLVFPASLDDLKTGVALQVENGTRFYYQAIDSGTWRHTPAWTRSNATRRMLSRRMTAAAVHAHRAHLAVPRTSDHRRMISPR